jgi:hypothetical protein
MTITRDSLLSALNERDLFNNPDLLEEHAEEIDCSDDCENFIRECDVNTGNCRISERGGYCPNDLAETLRALAALARRDGETK